MGTADFFSRKSQKLLCFVTYEPLTDHLEMTLFVTVAAGACKFLASGDAWVRSRTFRCSAGPLLNDGSSLLKKGLKSCEVAFADQHRSRRRRSLAPRARTPLLGMTVWRSRCVVRVVASNDGQEILRSALLTNPAILATTKLSFRAVARNPAEGGWRNKGHHPDPSLDARDDSAVYLRFTSTHAVRRLGMTCER